MIIVGKPWQHPTQPNRVHYVARIGQDSRRLWEPIDTGWGRFLVAAMGKP